MRCRWWRRFQAVGWARGAQDVGSKGPTPTPTVRLGHGVALGTSGLAGCSLPARLLSDILSQDVASEDVETVGPTRSRVKSREALDELLDTLRLLEEDPEPLPHPRALHKDRYAWMDEVTQHRTPLPSPVLPPPSQATRPGKAGAPAPGFS